MANLLAQWHEEHVRFGRLLDLLEGQVGVLRTGGQPEYQVMRDILYYLRHFADSFHHPREDVAFTRLAERDDSVRLLVSRLVQEHQAIAIAGDELMRRLDDIVAGTVIERAAVEAAAANYFTYYRHHLATEEAEILPRAADSLTPEDWAAVAAAVPDRPDPLFGADFEARYEELRRLVVSESQRP